jgi:hypothetical protein
MKKLISETINEIEVELILQHSSQRGRYLEDRLEELLEYLEYHPEAEYTPNSLELYCFKNPESIECRLYES